MNFLSAKLCLATGPLHLARTKGAALLPVFTVRQEPGTLAVTVQSPLAGVDNPEETYESVCQRYARSLEQFVLRYPDQWNPNWSNF